MPKSSERFSLRLAADHLRLLQDTAKASKKTPAALGSELLVRSLTNADTQELRDEVTELRSELRHVREDLATLALVLLVKSCGEEPAKAEAWVRKNLAP